MGSERKRDNLDKLYDALKSDGLVQKDRAQFRGKMLAPGMEGYRNRLALYKALKSDGLVKSGSYEEFSGYFLKRSKDGGAPAKPGGNAGGVGPSRLMTPSDLGGAWRYSPDALTDGKTGKWPQSLGTGGSQRPAAEPQGTVVRGRGADSERDGSTALPVGGGNAQGGSMGSGGNAQGFDWSKARGNGYMQQMRDEWDYMRMTGGMSGSLQDMKPDVWDPLRGLMTVALKRDGSGNVVMGSDGKPQTVVVADKDRARYAKELKEGADARRKRLEDGYDDRPITGFWEGAKQGSNLMWQGLKSFAGEALNLFGSNASDERAAIAVLDGLERNGYSGKQLEKVYIENGLVRDALKATGYDLGKAKAWLEEKGGREFSLGDKLMMEAKYEIDRARPTEGFAAWAGNLAPQMVPSAVGMAVGAVTKNPSLVKAVGAVGLSSAALSTAGLSMKEARDHGATNGQTWAVGLADAAIECVTEKIPFDRYTKRLVSGGKRRVAREMADAVSVSGSTAQKELGRLLEEASGKLGGRLFGSRSVKEFMADVAAEGTSEFVAEALETVTPMIYQKPEEYPTLSGILENGFEGMKGGLFMGSVLGGLSHVARRSQDRSRWKEQGGVYAGRTADGEVVEIVGHDKERGVFSVLRDGEVSEVADGDMSASHWFGYDEFMSGMLQHDSDAGYESGYSETSPDGMNERKNLAEVRRRKVVELLGEDAAGMLDEYGAEFAEGLELGDGERDAVLRYLEAKSAFDGMVQRVRDDIDGRLDENAREIDSNVNRVDSGGDGMVHPAVMKVGDRRVYVVSGRAVMSEDGTVVDLERSDESVVVRDAETGELEMVSPSALLRVDAAVDAEAEKAESGARIREAAAEEAAGLIDGRVGAAVGDVYETVGGDGVRHSVRVVGVDEGSGGVVVAVDGNEGSPVTMGLDELQAGVDAARVADLEAREAAELGEEGQAAGEGPAAEQPGTVVEGGNAEETAGTAGTDGTAGTALSRVPVDGRSGEPLFERADRETALDALYEVTDGDGERARAIVNAQLDQSSKALEALKKKPPRQKAVKLTGSPMQMAMAQQKAADDYKADMERYEAQLKDAKEKLDSWTGIYTLMNERARMVQDAQRARELAGHEAAVRERQQEFEARKQAEAAREAVGNGNPMPAITEKWNSAEKIDGHRDEIVLPNGERIKGRYVLHESGAASPSHDPQTWEKTDGFPMDGNGNSVNDRDYERDKDAQRVTQDIARSYDHRALQSPVVVSRDGVVLSGNGRTMAGELAARDNTDGDYIGYLKEYAGKYGFTPEQVAGMAHPRVSFVPDESMPYTAETFAKFNQQEMKSQNKTEYAVKLGKTVGDETFRRIVRSINGYDSLAAFYADDKGGVGAVYELHSAGVVPKAQLAEMVDVSSGEKRLSAIGREMLENMLVGKAFAGSPDVVRMLTSVPSMRQSVITALGEIVDNVGLGREWSLQHELAEAVKLVYAARTDGRFGFGDIVSVYARQGVLFADPDQLQTVADFNNVTMLLLADVLNDKRVTLLKHVIALYNGGARQSANGEQDLFEGGIRSREEILKDIIRFINENYGKRKEIEAARAAALERRKAESVQQDGTAPAVGGGSEDTGGSGRGEAPVERKGGLAQAEATAEHPVERTGDRSVSEWFGPVYTQFEGKADEAESHLRETTDGVAKGALTYPGVAPIDLVWGDMKAGYMKIVIKHPEVVGKLQSILSGTRITSQSDNRIVFESDTHKMIVSRMKGSRPTDNWLLTAYEKKEKPVSASSSDIETEPEGKRNGTATPQNGAISDGKGSEKNGAVQIGTEKTEGPAAEPPGTVVNGRLGPAAEQPGTVVEGGNAAEVTPGAAAGDVATAVAAAEASTDVSPTEGQKKAGNYRKGHVRIDGFDVSIEQPKGSVRRGTDADGKKWEQKMNNTYGYIRGTEGVDGEHIDVFLSDDPSQGDVFVVDQVNGDGSFDEHKVMYGFASEEEARRAYLSNYEDGWTGLGAITHVTKEEFRKWVNSSHRKTKPFADYKHVKATTEDVDQRRTNVNEDGLVVDSEGNPLTLYHGTPNDVEFGSLESGHVRDGEEVPARFNGNGISFTPDRTVAVEYATRGGGEGKVFSVNVILKKPYFTLGVANFSPEEAAAFTDGLIAKGHDGIINYASKIMRESGALPNEVIVFDMNGVRQTGDVKGKTDSQGNPLNEDGTLKLEKITSVDNLTDKDFSAPTRNVELPVLPKNVDKAIGANGKPVIIKKNIFERNAERHADLTAEDSRNILQSALYNPDLYGQNQKAKRPYNWVVINTKDKEGKNRLVLLELSPEKENAEIVHWHYIDDRGLEKIKRQAEREDGQLLILPSESEEAGALSSRTPDLSSDGKVRNDSANSQRNGVENGAVEDYVSMAERRFLEEEAKRNAAGFAMETPEEAAAFDRRVGEMSDLELLSYIKEDGNGDINRAYHPSVYDEFDYRYGDEIMAAHDWYLDSLRENVTTLEQAEDMLANILRDKSLLATDRRAELLGQEEALQDYIVELENREDKQVRQQKGSGVGDVSPREVALRDELVDVLRGAGVEVSTDVEEGQRVLDRANGEARMQAKKRALETASVTSNEEHQPTVVSSADGAKVLKNLDKLVEDFETLSNQSKFFTGTVAKALGATRHNSKSEYATFETKNGRVVTIRLADHNATVSNFDMRGELDGISIVVSPKKSAGVTNDGDAHVVEYYYDSIKLRRADGKPLADIVRSIKQALYSGEFNDTTGLAEVQEVNADEVRQQKVYHGSGADFDAFDHSHMGEGEGAQAYGWGTYVTEVEGIGRAYAMANNNSLRKSKLESDISRLKEALPFRRGDAKREGEEELKRLEEELSMFDESWKSVLYTVEIPDDNGGNYLSWEKRVKDIPQDKQQSIVTLLQNNGWTLNEENPLADFIKRYEKQDKSIVINQLASGADLYEEFSQALGSPQKASKLLSEAGFTGISYPTGYLSGFNQDGKRNYVIFNDADARITDKVRFFRTPDGHAYGFTKGGNIYIDPRIATAETPIHEYAHLWSSAMRELNPEEWGNIVGLMKGTGVWDEVKRLYPELKTDDEIADEVLAHYSGRRGAERLRSAQAEALASDGGVLDKAAAVSGIERVRQALGRFWKGVADWLGIHFTTAEDVADKVLSDLLHGVNPAFAVKDGGVRYDANSEEAGIVARAKAEGTYMKATNGQPSKLTPRQWVQVRTRAFKEWFGDWEKAARVLEVIPALKEHGFKNFDEAKAWAKEHIVRTLTDAETGGKGEIRISNNAVAKFLSESAVAKSDSKDVHLSVLKVLPDVIRESVDAEQHPDYKKGGDGSRSVGNGVNEHVTIHRLYGAVNIDGKTYRVKVTLKEDRTNNEPQKAYSYEATKIELLAGQHEEAVTSSRNSNNSITAANLLQDVEKSYGNGEKLLDCSKVVDENGEPRVVYHQTNSTIFVNRKTGENFENLGWKEKDYWQNEASEEEWNDTWEEQDFYSFDNKTHGRRSFEMPAFFFSPVYDEYHEYGDRTVEAFLNIRNPIVNPDIPNRGVTDTAGEDAMKALIEQGYDGFIREYDGEVEEINAFFPNQIKSAEENVGTFDEENPDIRYQFVGEKGAGAVVGKSSAYKAKDGSTVTWRSLFSEEEMRGISEERDGVGSFDPTSVRLRKLEAGETCHVERRYVENGMFDFTGKDKIESDDDVAYIFRQLENAAVENSFMVLVKDGKPTVIHLAMGAYSSTMAPFEQAFVAYSKLNPDDVYFVHNHPSGKLQASRQDQETLDRIKKAFGDDVVNPGIIIDTTSGKYGMFDGMNIEQEMPVVQEGAVPIKVYNFGKQVFARDWNPRNAFKIKSSDDVAEFISSHRLGEHKKMSLLVLGNDNSVVANLFLPFTRIGNLDNVRDVCNLMSDYIHQCGGVCGFLYGNYDYTSDENRLISRISSRMKQLGTRLMDVIHVEHSAYNEGVVYEPEASDESLDVVNKRFNAELGRLTDENKDKVVLSLGRPSDILLAAGVSEKPMKLYGNKVIKKMKKHGFALAELKDLPRAVADPIAVFDNIGREGNRSILTELRTEQGNFLVTVDLGKGLDDIDFNIISSVFGKRYNNVVDWINKGLATYINKEKALDYLHHSAPIAEALSNPKLVSAAKVVESFENPRLGVEENGYGGHRTLRPSVEGGLAGKAAAAKRERAGQMAERLNTRVGIIEDVEEITHPNAAVQERRRRSKGWYDTKTGEVVVVIPNNRDVEDVAATVAHEAIAHKGLRELVGEERYDEFLDEVYGHLREDLKKAVDAAAGRAFVADVMGNGGRAKSYEQHRSRAVDELFGRLAEKPFEEFSEGERTLWQKLKAAVRKLLDKFLGTLKLPKWFELGDNELRYMLWRSKERLERGREHPIDLARDIVKREELGLTDEARYNMGDAPETFKARQRRAVENKGTVMPGLNDAQVKVVDNIPRHPYTGNIAEATSQAIEAAKAKYAPNGEPKTLHYKNFGVEFDYSISGNAIEIVLSAKHQGKSVNKGVHLALAEHLDRVIGESIEVEEHPDRIKTGDVRDNSKINPDALMHRFYGVARIDGKDYRVMTLMKEENRQGESNGIHSYEVQKIEVLNDETPSTSNGVGTPNSELEAYPLAKLIQKVGKTMETDKNLLDESKLADESTDLYRDGGETDDVWTDGSMGLQERITAAAVRLSGNHREDRKLRNDAVRVIGSNLSELRKAMGLQRTFDMTTVKRVADLARVLISSGYISNATSGEVKRLLSAVKNSVGHENIDESIRKVMDIMVDNQLKQGEAALHELESIKGSKVWTNCHAYVADALSK